MKEYLVVFSDGSREVVEAGSMTEVEALFDKEDIVSISVLPEETESEDVEDQEE
jgi:hypothetical protein